jgi:hypothetical protein
MTDKNYSNPVPYTENVEKPNVSLAELLSDSFQKRKNEIKSLNAIIRCEHLPVIKGDKKQLGRLFDNLIDIILKHPPKTSRLFLYVDCVQERESYKKGYRTLIKFITNVIIEKNWKDKHADLLMDSNQIITSVNGTFSITSQENKGCLFTITLPGKAI